MIAHCVITGMPRGMRLVWVFFAGMLLTAALWSFGLIGTVVYVVVGGALGLAALVGLVREALR